VCFLFAPSEAPHNTTKMSPSSPSRSDLDKRWKSALALYHGEDDVNKDEDLAFKNFYELANKGHEPSMLELGRYFMPG